MRPRRRAGQRAWIRLAAALGSAFLLAAIAPTAAAQDRARELEQLRDAIQDSRERVTAHEADERALLEQLEEVDRRLQSVSSQRNLARRDVSQARARLDELEPALAAARSELEATQQALAARAVALYRGGELGPVRILFSASSLPELLARASALRVLVRHDAQLVDRFGRERDRLAGLEVEARAALGDREQASARLARAVAELRVERGAKGEILDRVREDRSSERRLLLELEQAAQALEETIRQLGARAARDSGAAGSGFAAREGRLSAPVEATIAERFGRVVDPEYQTTTFRNGVEFAAPAGAAVRAVAPGIVRFAGWFRGYGRIVIVDHGDDFHTISGHLDEILVAVDQAIVEGETLGSVGETGSLRGPSLYFELRRGGDPIDPEPWLGAGGR